jgi:hypothetical protein
MNYVTKINSTGMGSNNTEGVRLNKYQILSIHDALFETTDGVWK